MIKGDLMDNPKIEFITVDKSFGVELIKILDLKPICVSCKLPITEKNFGGILPIDKVICDNICCMVENL